MRFPAQRKGAGVVPCTPPLDTTAPFNGGVGYLRELRTTNIPVGSAFA